MASDIQYSFERVEKKYMLTRPQRDALLNRIGSHFKADTHPTYLGLAALFFALFAAAFLLLGALHFGKGDETERILKITIPENLDYDGLFTDVFRQYLKSCALEQVKTTNMGTLYELQYRVVFRQPQISKAFLDELRCRNGNLNIVCTRVSYKEAL